MRHFLRSCRVTFGLLTIPALLVFCYAHFSPGGSRHDTPWFRELLFQLWDWYSLALAVPVVFWVVRRFPIERRRWLKHAAIQFAIGALFVPLYSAHAAVYFQFYYAAWARRTLWNRFTQNIDGFFTYYTIVYAAMLCFGHALNYYRKLRERERETMELNLRMSQLETKLTRARFSALKMQLHPHFLFNTLNTISALVRQDDKKAAVRMIAGLSDLLRRTLDEAEIEEVPLSQEIDFIAAYLNIERLRFEDRLKVELSVDSRARDCLIPYFLVLPLVENSIQHGVAKRSSASLVRVRAWCDDMLNVEIVDDGPGLPENGARSQYRGIGLGNTRERLRQQFGADHSMVLENRPEGGARVLIRIPICMGEVRAEA